MAVCIDSGVVDKTCKFAQVDRCTVAPVRCPTLPTDFFQAEMRTKALDDDTKSLNLQSVLLQNGGEANWYHPSPITMCYGKPLALHNDLAKTILRIAICFTCTSCGRLVVARSCVFANVCVRTCCITGFSARHVYTAFPMLWPTLYGLL